VDVPERNEKYSKLKNFQFEIFMKVGEERQSSKGGGAASQADESYISPLKMKEIMTSARKADE